MKLKLFFLFVFSLLLLVPSLALTEPTFVGNINEKTKQSILDTLYAMPLGCFIGVNEIIFYEKEPKSTYCTNTEDGCYEFLGTTDKIKIHIGNIRELLEKKSLRGLLYHEACGHGLQHTTFSKNGKLAHDSTFRRGIQLALNWAKAEGGRAFGNFWLGEWQKW